MKAWATVGNVCPTFRVPGIRLSGIIFHSRKAVVLVANDPMPSVSKKLETAPTASCSGPGPRSAFDQPTTYTPVNAPSAHSKPLIGFMDPCLQVKEGKRKRNPAATGGATGLVRPAPTFVPPGRWRRRLAIEWRHEESADLFACVAADGVRSARRDAGPRA